MLDFQIGTYRKELLQKVKMLKRVNWPKQHYHPSFLANMERNILSGREIVSNAQLLVERSFARYFPGGVRDV